ncbi:hypothetical protein PA598K_01420 [Paenibacillus sp. 598K]|uniref:hypothetical protein n=1 Tax=Paenibacillus sp. 598K TaxID=1117987 RepID=UPI000FF9B79D|nr:hypothetical protein [Paenibacillus sp. 598K]GBF73135.1 hypothetical protein PA598K_01420 [Paenibacillus sp. 598K]
MTTTINALFNKHTRDSKKESMTFYVKGTAEEMPELQHLHRSVVVLRLKGVDAHVVGEFKKLNRDDKKTTLEFEIKGGTSLESSGKFFAVSGTDVELSLEATGEDVEDFREAQKEYRKGVKGAINADGTVDVDRNQMTIDDAQDPMDGVV